MGHAAITFSGAAIINIINIINILIFLLVSGVLFGPRSATPESQRKCSSNLSLLLIVPALFQYPVPVSEGYRNLSFPFETYKKYDVHWPVARRGRRQMGIVGIRNQNEENKNEIIKSPDKWKMR